MSRPKTSTDHDEEDRAWAAFFERARSMMSTERDSLLQRPEAPEVLAKRLALDLPADPQPLSAVVDGLFALAETSPSTSSPRFFNQLFGGRTAAATMGEVLAALLNNSMYTYKAAGPQVIVEKLLSERMCTLAGFHGGEGTFTPGGSMSNLLAMIVARGERFPDSRENGIGGETPIVYTSELGHYSIPKNAGLAGIGRARVRRIPADPRGRMRPDALAEQITRDLSDGLTPYFVNATAGTTVLGAFDPLREISSVARENGLWFHVDGALGGSLLLSKETRHLLEGIECADSMTWDAHKMMGVPLTCSVFLVREPGVLVRHLSEAADYLFHDGGSEYDRGQTSLQCGRRNDALKLWAAWQALGDAGLAQRIENAVESARYAAQRIRTSKTLVLEKEPESVNVVFSVKDVEARTLCDALHQAGLAVVGSAGVEGKQTVRLSCVNSCLGRPDIDAFVDAAERVGRELSPPAGERGVGRL